GVAIAVAGATLTSESFLPPNGAIDIGETVSVILRLRNVSNVSTLNLVGTLLATDGVAPTAPTTQTYGVLAPSGFPVGRVFTFTASGTNGQTIHPTLQLHSAEHPDIRRHQHHPHPRPRCTESTIPCGVWPRQTVSVGHQRLRLHGCARQGDRHPFELQPLLSE